jgi:hypothetical protein
MDHPSRAGYPEGWDTLATLFRFWPLLRTKRFRGHRCPLRRKENSPRGVGWLLRGPSRRRQLRERCGNVNPLPFRCREPTLSRFWFARIFMDHPSRSGYPKGWDTLTTLLLALSPHEVIPGSSVPVKKKRKLSPGCRLASPRSFASPLTPRTMQEY